MHTARSFSEVCPGVWCFADSGLSNQSFIDAPKGIIATDTGESIEEINEAITELRKVAFVTEAGTTRFED